MKLQETNATRCVACRSIRVPDLDDGYRAEMERTRTRRT